MSLDKNINLNKNDQEKVDTRVDVSSILDDSIWFKKIQAGDFDGIQNISTLDVETAQYIKDNFTGYHLNLSKISYISVEVAKILSSVSTYIFEIGVDDTTPLEVFRFLLQSKSDALILSGVTDLERIAEFVQLFFGDVLSFPSVTHLLEKNIGEALSIYVGDLEFKNIEFITLEVFEGLVGYSGKLCIDSAEKEFEFHKGAYDVIKNLGLNLKLEKRKKIQK